MYGSKITLTSIKLACPVALTRIKHKQVTIVTLLASIVASKYRTLSPTATAQRLRIPSGQYGPFVGTLHHWEYSAERGGGREWREAGKKEEEWKKRGMEKKMKQ